MQCHGSDSLADDRDPASLTCTKIAGKDPKGQDTQADHGPIIRAVIRNGRDTQADDKGRRSRRRSRRGRWDARCRGAASPGMHKDAKIPRADTQTDHGPITRAVIKTWGFPSQFIQINQGVKAGRSQGPSIRRPIARAVARGPPVPGPATRQELPRPGPDRAARCDVR